jgi:hypothetical protein
MPLPTLRRGGVVDGGEASGLDLPGHASAGSRKSSVFGGKSNVSPSSSKSLGSVANIFEYASGGQPFCREGASSSGMGKSINGVHGSIRLAWAGSSTPEAIGIGIFGADLTFA